MRTHSLFILLVAFAASIHAQESLKDVDDDTGGFGGPVVKLTTITRQTALMIGGRGGWILDHTFLVGGGVYTLVTDVDGPTGIYPTLEPLDVDFSWFGLELEHIFKPSELIHYSLYAFVGGGAVRYVKDVGPVSTNATQVDETDLAFVFEPAANAELNVTSWCRITAGVSYRIVAGVTLVGLSNGDFTGPAATLTVKFGNF